MREIVHILTVYGYAIVFLWVFVEQIGFPIPALPVLLTAGALAWDGRINLGFALASALLACLAADTIWYELGKRRGSAVLNVLCKLSLEPDSCVERTRGVFDRRGTRSLLYAKYVPGLNTVAAPIAGMSRIPYPRFVAFDLLGSLLWSGPWLLVGYLFSEKVDAILQHSQIVGRFLLLIAMSAVAGWIVWKYDQRRRFLKSVQVARITPQELHAKLASGEEVTIIDLRHPLDVLTDPRTIPGALQIRMDELPQRANDIPRDREIVLYCT